MTEAPAPPDPLAVTPPLAPPPAPPPDSWLDLGLYVVGGFGAFMLASLAVGLAIRRLGGGQITIGASLAIYAVNFLCLAGAVYGLGILRHKFTWADLGLRRQAWRWYWPLLAVVITVGLLPLRAMLALLVQWLTGGGLQSLQTRMQVFAPNSHFSWLDFGVTLLGAGVLAPIAEELYFRGLIHRALRPRFRFWLRVLLSTGFFALAHFDSAAVVASSFVLGAANAAAFELTDSLWLPILTHAFNNSLAVCLVYMTLLLGPLLQKGGMG